MGIPDHLIEHGTPKQLYDEIGLDAPTPSHRRSGKMASARHGLADKETEYYFIKSTEGAQRPVLMWMHFPMVLSPRCFHYFNSGIMETGRHI